MSGSASKWVPYKREPTAHNEKAYSTQIQLVESFPDRVAGNLELMENGWTAKAKAGGGQVNNERPSRDVGEDKVGRKSPLVNDQGGVIWHPDSNFGLDVLKSLHCHLHASVDNVHSFYLLFKGVFFFRQVFIILYYLRVSCYLILKFVK